MRCKRLAEVTHILIHLNTLPPGQDGPKKWQIYLRIPATMFLKLEFCSGYYTRQGCRGEIAITKTSHLPTLDVPESLEFPLLIPVNPLILEHLINTTVESDPYNRERLTQFKADMWCTFTILREMEKFGLLAIGTARDALDTMMELRRSNPRQ